MSAPHFRQYFGPSARHDRACVELIFPVANERISLAPFDAPLTGIGFKLPEILPDAPLPLDEAICRLAGALLAKHADWWSRHGQEDGRGWAALAHPYPRIAALALGSAHDLIRAAGKVSPELTGKLKGLSQWLSQMSQIRLRMLGAAQVFGREATIVHAVGDVYQIGQAAKGLHWHRTSNERDSLTGMQLERNKFVTGELLQRFGLPATRCMLAGDPSEAGKAIDRVGLPCVVKPITMSRGIGVATGLQDESQVAAAIAHAIKLSGEQVLVENHVPGDDHRLMVVGDELLWVYRKLPATVTGDGTATVRALIEQENRRRAAIRRGTEAYLYQIAIDPPFIRYLSERYALGVDAVLAAGRTIELASQANIARGGLLEDVTGRVHPDNRELAIRVARLFRIDSLGIDYITPDISRSWKELDTAIVEVNRTPGISGMGDTTLVLRTLFPNRLSGRVPTVAVIGDAAYCETTAQAFVGAFAALGLNPVVADYARDETTGSKVLVGARPEPVERALLDPEADAIVLRADAHHLEHCGLPLQGCDLVAAAEPGRFPWIGDGRTVLGGALSHAKIEHAVARLVRTYRDPREGGPLPVLAPAAAECAPEGFRLTVWRARAMPRAWFWSEVGLEPTRREGLTTHEDLLDAIRALADDALAGAAALPRGFAYDELVGSWFRPTFDAEMALPEDRRDAARAALLAATERVNAIVAMPISMQEPPA